MIKRLLTLLAFSTLLMGYAQYQTFNGVVLDSLGNPKKDAVVCVVQRSDHGFSRSYYHNCQNTNRLGKYHFYNLKEGVFLEVTIPYDSLSVVKYYEYKIDPFDKTPYIIQVEKVETIGIVNDSIVKKNKIITPSFPIKKLSEKEKMDKEIENSRFSNSNIARIDIVNDSAQFRSDHEIIQGLLDIRLSLGYQISEVDHIPALQNQYVQGRPIGGVPTYQPPATQDPFSWGPLASSVAGLSVYDPKDFFEKAESVNAAVHLSYGSKNGDNYQLNFSTKQSTGIFQPIEEEIYRIDGKYNPMWYDGDLVVHAGFSQSQNQMPLFGNNWANTLFGLYSQPISFNAQNPVIGNAQNTASQSYNNPYFLTRFNQDQKKHSTFFAGVNYELQDSYDWQFNGKFDLNINQNNWRFGQIPQSIQVPEPQFIERDVSDQFYALSLSAKTPENDGLFAKLKTNSQLNSIQLDKNIWSNYSNFSNFPNGGTNQVFPNIDLNRFTTNIELEIDFEKELWNDVILHNNFNQGVFFTNTNEQTGVYYFKNHTNFNFNIYTDMLEDFDFYISYEKSYSEPALLSNDLNFNALQYSLNDFQNYLESEELFIENQLEKLQQKNTLEIGLRTSHFRNLFRFHFNFYRFEIQNAFAPIFQNNGFQWENVANYHQNGFEASMDFNWQILKWEKIKFQFNTNFHTYRNKTEEILIDDVSRVPFFGFQDVTKNYIEGQPVGVLVGSAYQRNENGQRIIGADGFPLVANDLQVIADPNPDFVWNFNPSLKIYQFKIAASFEWSKGGEIWNGTQQTLNYFGRSQITADLRNTENFIFDGVLADGTPNTIPVDFANPANDVSTNRWVRYGLNGVAEEAIEDATYFRISEISIAYEVDNIFNDRISNLSLRAFMTNPWVNTDYQGAFPGNNLLGNSAGNGMDYFNMPLLKTYGISLNLTF